MNIKSCISKIMPADSTAYDECISRFDTVAKPVGSLGKLEELLARIGAISGSSNIDISRKAVLVFCADNGVVRHGVAEGGSEVTTAIAGMLANGTASVSVMANVCGAEVFTIDIGMADTVSGLRDMKLMRGTDDMTEGPAMSRDTAEKAVLIGIESVKEMKKRGFKLIATGEAGIGNTTASSAVCAALLGKAARDVTGRGAGLSDEGLTRKLDAIKKALEVNRPDKNDPTDVLHKLGGLDIAALTGVFLGGALYSIPIVMDGFISGVAALLAVRMCSDVRGYILPSHMSAEPGAGLLMNELGFSPVLNADMRLGEGTGAVLLFPLLDAALAVYKDAATFTDISVEQYKRMI